jgi:hypothetical protein
MSVGACILVRPTSIHSQSHLHLSPHTQLHTHQHSTCPPGTKFRLKVSAFPKTMEMRIGEVLLDEKSMPLDTDTHTQPRPLVGGEEELTPSAKNATHILHVCHAPG